MKKISLTVSDESQLPFLLKLLSHFDYIKLEEDGEIKELLEDIAIARAIEEGENSGKISKEDALAFLEDED